MYTTSYGPVRDTKDDELVGVSVVCKLHTQVASATSPGYDSSCTNWGMYLPNFVHLDDENSAQSCSNRTGHSSFSGSTAGLSASPRSIVSDQCDTNSVFDGPGRRRYRAWLNETLREPANIGRSQTASVPGFAVSD